MGCLSGVVEKISDIFIHDVSNELSNFFFQDDGSVILLCMHLNISSWANEG